MEVQDLTFPALETKVTVLEDMFKPKKVSGTLFFFFLYLTPKSSSSLTIGFGPQTKTASGET